MLAVVFHMSRCFLFPRRSWASFVQAAFKTQPHESHHHCAGIAVKLKDSPVSFLGSAWMWSSGRTQPLSWFISYPSGHRTHSFRRLFRTLLTCNVLAVEHEEAGVVLKAHFSLFEHRFDVSEWWWLGKFVVVVDLDDGELIKLLVDSGKLCQSANFDVGTGR